MSPSDVADDPTTIAVASRGAVGDRSVEVAVDDGQGGGHVRAGRAGVGADRADGPEAHVQVPDPRGVALEDVQRGGGAVAEDVAVHGWGEERVARDLDLVGGPGRAEDPEVGLDGGVGCARGAAHDADLVDDHVGSPQQPADPERAGGEDDDQRRHRDPRPLTPVQPAQDEVVHRSHQQDVAEQQDHDPADRG